jgi:pimeloyl-ACP methyl ester carboxylesterase
MTSLNWGAWHGGEAWSAPARPGGDRADAAQVVETVSRIRPDGYVQAARLLSTGDITADIARLPVGLPIQVIVGEADVITAPAVNLEIAAACPAASIHVIPGAGHALYLEKPQQFNRLLAGFVAAHDRVASSADPGERMHKHQIRFRGD